MANYYGECQKCKGAVMGKEYVALCYDCLLSEKEEAERVTAALDWRIQELEHELSRYENSPTCNKGHVNVLPLRLWDCPVCTEELRQEVERLKLGIVSIIFMQ